MYAAQSAVVVHLVCVDMKDEGRQQRQRFKPRPDAQTLLQHPSIQSINTAAVGLVQSSREMSQKNRRKMQQPQCSRYSQVRGAVLRGRKQIGETHRYQQYEGSSNTTE